jgi:hypothetical protein
VAVFEQIQETALCRAGESTGAKRWDGLRVDPFTISAGCPVKQIGPLRMPPSGFGSMPGRPRSNALGHGIDHFAAEETEGCVIRGRSALETAVAVPAGSGDARRARSEASGGLKRCSGYSAIEDRWISLAKLKPRGGRGRGRPARSAGSRHRGRIDEACRGAVFFDYVEPTQATPFARLRGRPAPACLDTA